MLAKRYKSSGRFKFYDLIKQGTRRPAGNASPVSQTGKAPASTSFSGNYTVDKSTAEERIRRVFGGRIAGEDRQSSSRRLIGKPRFIGGVKVPDKPKEPDNCCMSGCVNCVWEIYNDDVKDWNLARERAASQLVRKGGKWPADFWPPVSHLRPENLEAATKEEVAAEKRPKKEVSGEGWDKVPVQIRVFAEMEKKLKGRRKNSVT